MRTGASTAANAPAIVALLLSRLSPCGAQYVLTLPTSTLMMHRAAQGSSSKRTLVMNDALGGISRLDAHDTEGALVFRRPRRILARHVPSFSTSISSVVTALLRRLI